eukprot:1077996-Amphidinium_carterae.1
MAPKAATPAAKAAATAAAAAAAEAQKANNAFKNFRAYAHRSEDPTRVQAAEHLGQYFASLNSKDKKSFVQSWYQRCGTKGDLGGFMKSELESKASTIHAGKTGFMYPGQIADDMKLKAEYFPTKDDY